MHLYPRITRKRSDRYEQSCFWHNVSSDRIASNALWTHRISSDRIASTAVLTRFQFAVFRFGIVMTANLAAHQEPLGRSFRRERLAQGRYVMAWFGFEPMFFQGYSGTQFSSTQFFKIFFWLFQRVRDEPRSRKFQRSFIRLRLTHTQNLEYLAPIFHKKLIFIFIFHIFFHIFRIWPVIKIIFLDSLLYYLSRTIKISTLRVRG